jgi:hypothetical protein
MSKIYITNSPHTVIEIRDGHLIVAYDKETCEYIIISPLKNVRYMSMEDLIEEYDLSIEDQETITNYI